MTSSPVTVGWPWGTRLMWGPGHWAVGRMAGVGPEPVFLEGSLGLPGLQSKKVILPP